MSNADPITLTKFLSEQTDKRLEILRRIRDVGSISEAARGAGVSYKAAWQAIETLSNIAGGPLVEKTVGGSKGGGTTLTDTGLKVLEIANELARARAEVLSRFLTADGKFRHMGSSTLRTSLRNQFPAIIEKMKIGSALVRLILKIDNSHLIKVSVTKESAQLLSLKEGMEVLALSKATSVTIMSDFPKEGSNFQKDNLLVGEVIHCDRAMHGGECTIKLPSGLTIVGFAKRAHGLHLNQKAVAVIPPSAIVISLIS